MLTRESIEATPYRERPQVRAMIDRVNIYEDGRRERVQHRFHARIDLDGNNPWLTANLASRPIAFRVSWGLLLEVLNDPHAAPIEFLGMEVEYEV